MEIAENIDIIEYEWLGEEDGSVMMAAEDSWRGLAVELNELHFVKGAAFVEQLRNIVYWGGFRLVEGETNIFSALGEQSEDFDNLLNAARKAVEHGYFEQKSNYKLYDLKTITGKASVETRLLESIGQTNRVLLNMAVNYNARLLASDIKTYFEVNPDAVEVLIFKGKKILSISRYQVQNPKFNRLFRKKYEK